MLPGARLSGWELQCSMVGVLPYSQLWTAVWHWEGPSAVLVPLGICWVHPGFIFTSISTQRAGVWKKGKKFLILTISFPVWKWKISFHDQMGFYFSSCWGWLSALQALFSHSPWPGGSTRKLVEIQVVQIPRFRVLQTRRSLSVSYRQVPLAECRFTQVLELPCKLGLFATSFLNFQTCWLKLPVTTFQELSPHSSWKYISMQLLTVVGTASVHPIAEQHWCLPPTFLQGQEFLAGALIG